MPSTQIASKHISSKHAPWALLPCVLLTLSSVTLLVPPRAVRAEAPRPAAAAAYDDGDGDELLEHWGDPKYSREERLQMAGIAVLGVPVFLLFRRRRAAGARKAGRKAGRI